jgi:hypothetical protein
MSVVNVIQFQSLLDRNLTHWVSENHGLLVICPGAGCSKHVIDYMRTNCETTSLGGLRTADGIDVTIYEECSDIFTVECVFMLPARMTIDGAISDIRGQIHSCTHLMHK